MSTTRVMTGVADFSGKKINSLRIGAMIARRPEPKYDTTCMVCGTKSTETQSRIRSGVAKCLNSGCGKDRLREIVNDTPSRARRREEAAESARRREREERRAAELAEAEETFRKTSKELALTIREQILKGKDDELFVSPELLKASMPSAEAQKFNGEQAAIFVRETPEYEKYRSNATLNEIMEYFSRNGVRIFDAAMIRAAFHRLRDFGVIQKRPVPNVEPEPRPQPTRVNLTIEHSEPEPAKPSGPKTYIGRDWETGMEREFTEREINRMSSKEYARAFPVAPTIAELLSAMQEQRSQQ
jgi:hypothetical protein